MAQKFLILLRKHKNKLFFIGLGLFIAFVINSEFLYLPEELSTKSQIKNSSQTKDPITTNTIKRIQNFTIINTYVREDKLFYTQGLTFKDSDTIVESVGLYGESAIQLLDSKNMKVIKNQMMDTKYFGEGCDVVINDTQEEIYQLTWRERKILVWDANDLTLKKEIDLPHPIAEGWGLVKRIEKDEDEKEILNFYITDGSNKIYVVDGKIWKVKKIIEVKTIQNRPLYYLNELEFIHGKLWANVYYSNSLFLINIETGIVDTILDLSSLEKLARNKANELNKKWQKDYVMNGIAYDFINDRLIVTGKYWPLIWEIKVGIL